MIKLLWVIVVIGVVAYINLGDLPLAGTVAELVEIRVPVIVVNMQKQRTARAWHILPGFPSFVVNSLDDFIPGIVVGGIFHVLNVVQDLFPGCNLVVTTNFSYTLHAINTAGVGKQSDFAALMKSFPVNTFVNVIVVISANILQGHKYSLAKIVQGFFC